MRHLKNDKIGVKTSQRFMSLVTEIVEKKISALISGKIALAFDGWSSGFEHYIAVFAKYSYECDSGYESKLLAFSPF